jgi:protocatechuate 3,4-dioxygenase beta subunit
MRLLLFFFFLVSMKATNHINQANHCKISKICNDNYEPEKFNPSNNLIKSEGDLSVSKDGQVITIKGILRDNFCVPIQDAKIYLWQPNEKGKYIYKILRSNFSSEGAEENPASLFQGSGIATSDNNGEFRFVTIFPGAHHKEHPHINIRVEHPTLGNLQTKIYLKKNESATKTEKIDLKLNIAKESLIAKKDTEEQISENFIDFLEEEIDDKHKGTPIYKMLPGYDFAFPSKNNEYDVEIILHTNKNYRRY